MSDYLPEHLVVKILTRLPAKSLMRFKCVSKRWRSLISSDSQFAKTHFQLASAHQTLTHGFLVCTSTHIPQLESSVLESPSFGDRSSARKLAHPSKPTEDEEPLPVILLGSCHGFVFTCLRRLRSHYQNYSIWNPTTGFFLDLPDPGFTHREEYFYRSLFYHGIGYVQETDEYKVVVSTAYSHTLKVLSLRDHQNWRDITYSYSSLPFLHETEGVALHETLHWVGYGFGRQITPYLIAFELRNEEFRTMQLPMASIVKEEFLALFTWRGCLCVWLCGIYSAQTVQGWVMEKYGDADSWTRGYSFSVNNPPPSARYLRPLLITEKSTFILRYSTENLSIRLELVRLVENQEEEVVTYVYGWHKRNFGWGSLMVVYDETLFCSVMMEPKQLERERKKLKTQHQGITTLE